MATAGVRPVFGAAGFGFGDKFSDEDMGKCFDILLEGGCNTMDTARTYRNSEERMGRTGAGKRFIIDSKTPGALAKGEGTGAAIQQHVKETLEKLKISQLDIFYIHAPDVTVSINDQLAGIDAAYRSGAFKRFGISNFSAEQVERVCEICKAKGYVMPTVYQGNYSAFARLQEAQIMPTLRKLNIAFYAYSPSAGGLLTKTSAAILGNGSEAGRFGGDDFLAQLYNGLYNKPTILKGLDDWGSVAERAGISKAELAYRWVIFDSELSAAHGDAVIFGGSSLEQVSQTLGWFKKGSVGPEAKAAIDKIWASIKDESALNNIPHEGAFKE